ncbi:hypothetical protein [Chitinophaga sp. Cy-1792]|uniref:hypothetical protein n=1 Tax=Chitinophaga sp. Cy-1792 TaxID=2608339 RepID=UPI0014202973|nr:hypothetical protein [Chitinophaga sp. Cy-1792]NIG51994.1 hypothetical protein [Chitinophaga sp. Cy-1792]
MKVTKYLSFAVLLLIALTNTAFGQTLTDILNKHYAALGGIAKISSVKTQYMEGTTSADGKNIDYKRWGLNDKAMRLQFEVMGTTNVQVVTDKSGWVLMPVMMQTSPQDMDAATLNAMKPMLDLTGSELYNYTAKGKTLSLIGKDTVNAKPAYKIKVVTKEGNVGYVFLDAESYYIVRAENTLKLGGQEQKMVSDFSDFRKTPDGYVYPAKSTQGAQGGMITMTIDKMEINKPIDESMFAKPAAAPGEVPPPPAAPLVVPSQPKSAKN